MITEAILSFICFLLETIVNTISTPTSGSIEIIEIPPDTFNALKKILTNVAYILPVNHFLTMFSIYAALHAISLSYSFVLLVRRWLPF